MSIHLTTELKKSITDLKIIISNSQDSPSLEKLRTKNEFKIPKDNINLMRTFPTDMKPFSFSQEFNGNRLSSITAVISNICNFREIEIKYMTAETIQIAIQKELEVWEKKFHERRETYFPDTEMIQSDYDDLRLSYLVEHQKEPDKVYSNDEYKYICENLLKLIHKLLINFFELNGGNYSFVLRSINHYYSRMLELFDNVHSSVIAEMWDFTTDRIKEGTLQPMDVTIYKSNKICLLTNYLNEIMGDFLEKEQDFQSNFTLYQNEEMKIATQNISGYFKFYFKHWDTVKLLLTSENLSITFNHLSIYISALLRLTTHLSGVQAMNSYNFIQKSISFINELAIDDNEVF